MNPTSTRRPYTPPKIVVDGHCACPKCNLASTVSVVPRGNQLYQCTCVSCGPFWLSLLETCGLPGKQCKCRLPKRMEA